LPFYILGTLTAGEVERVETYLRTNLAARKWVEEMSLVPETLGLSAGSAEPNPATKQQLLARLKTAPGQAEISKDADLYRTGRQVRGERPTDQPGLLARLRRRPLFARPIRLEPVVIVVSLVVAIISLAWAATINGRIVQLRQEVGDLQAGLADQGQIIRYLSSPDNRSVLIAGTEHQPGAQAQMVFPQDSQEGGLLIAGLRPLPAEQVYQLWLIEGETPQSAGTFSVDPSGKATVLVEARRAIADFDAVGVSIEPLGGSLQPTGNIVLLSSLSEDT
jgi:anti-sigma-K factor RskA